MHQELVNKQIDVKVCSNTIRWYETHGYTVPKTKVQLYYTNNKGERKKNGIEYRVKRGTSILVDVKDLPPASNVDIQLICSDCGNTYQTRFGAYKKKHSDKCSTCKKKEFKGNGTHGYWVGILIKDNPNAKCDISGETDKRFLVLHHLLSCSLGGINSPENYVILSANYHLAFHVWNGGMNKSCTAEKFSRFKEKELLANDWGIVE